MSVRSSYIDMSDIIPQTADVAGALYAESILLLFGHIIGRKREPGNTGQKGG